MPEQQHDKVMKKLFFNSALILALLFPGIIHAQLRNFSGTVVAFEKFPLKNITVKARKAKTEAITDNNGNFTMPVDKNDMIVIKDKAFMDYRKKLKDSDDSLRINLIINNNDKSMERAVDKGYISENNLEYGRDNLSQYNNEFIQCPDVYEAIRHAVPEARIITQSGKKGIMLRGQKSLLFSNTALIVVDGVEVDDPSFLSTSNIRKITKLSVSQCSMYYGMRGANGVINIETYH